MLIRILSRFALIQRIYAEGDGERHFAVQEKMGLGIDPSHNCHFNNLPQLANGQYACQDSDVFNHGSICDFRCLANMDSFEVKCHCLVKVAQPEADNWSNEQEESSGDYEVLEDLKLKIESSSRSSELQSSKIDELAEKIEVLENKEKELESENERLRNGFQDVIFENSIAHALLMQNVRSVQSTQVGQNLLFMKSLEDRLRAYEHQQREPIIEIKRDFIELKQEVTDNQVPLEEIVDLEELGNFIQQKVLSYLLQSTPNSFDEKTEK